MKGEKNKELLYDEKSFDISVLKSQILSTINHASPETMIRDLSEIRDSILDCGIDIEKFSIKDDELNDLRGKIAVESKILSYISDGQKHQDISKRLQLIKYKAKERKENFAKKLLLLIGILSS